MSGGKHRMWPKCSGQSGLLEQEGEMRGQGPDTEGLDCQERDSSFIVWAMGNH